MQPLYRKMMPTTDTPHTRVRGFVGETPRPRIPLTSIVGGGPVSSVSRTQQNFTDPGHTMHVHQMNSGSASLKRHAYASVPRWPATDYRDGMRSAARNVPPGTSVQGASSDARDVQYVATNASVRRRIGTTAMPTYASTSRTHPISTASSAGPSTSVFREGTAARLFGEDHMNMTTTRMLKGAPQSQEVVLFALHPQTVVRPLRRAVRQVFTGVLERLLDALQRQGMPRSVALARLNRTRWFPRLFDYTAIERLLNIFKLYLSQSDVLAVPRDFVDVYDAFAHEINRYCLAESTRPSTDDSSGGRAIVVGGIDFTEETLRSMTRPMEPWQQQTPLVRNHTPLQIHSVGSAIVGDVSARAVVNRRYIINQDNLSVLGSLVSHLQGVLKQRQKLHEGLLRQRTEIEAQLNERRRVLFNLCVSLTNRRILADSLDFKATFDEVHRQFNPSLSNHRNARALEEINQHMHIIGKCAKSLSKM
ncbi:uncharacterized protein BXIN_2158 [Babesia sp. Xinjiang]|uniref:uncharacterized protein n=1 Tax=Babesia sp. Xinjiang TaxID=462227 RepID=UPI000A25DBE9|nr:uncharacterized protein BXIN_2158 [Babesia sp. Xinjiang]ORM40485.1 hypothetical protein BXIN_2158 [Babesia sp. Xinjiang]